MNMTAKTVLSALLMIALALFTTQGALAAPTDTSSAMAIEVHKFDQPDSLRPAANGLAQDTSGLTPVSGATFSVKRVPGIDPTTNAGQREASMLTAVQAAEMVTGEPVLVRATTNASGHAVLAPLEAGLYFVEETFTPAGYVGAAPFLVSLPLTDPVARDHWLTTVHVYPKNASASISLDVVDEDAIALGDIVHWTSTSTIPNVPELDGYLVEQVIDPNLEYTGTPTVSISGGPELKPGIDYTVSFNPDTNTVSIEFTESGLRKLEEALRKDLGSEVVIEYTTIVLAEGEHVNEAILYPSRAAIDERRGVNDTAVTKWGPISVLVHEHLNPANLIAGACFMMYASEEDARAGTNPITIDGVSQWVTDEQGRLVVHGLRFSDFVNGLDRDTTDPLHRYYWAVPVCIPPGWSWVDDRPLFGAVTDTVDYETLIFEVKRAAVPEPPTTPDPPKPPTKPDLPQPPTTPDPPKPPARPDLPLTGAQAAGLGLFGAALIAAGALALASRRRQARESGAWSKQ